ncbi:MAG TPA: hypothetical protein VFP14_08120, partial [Novosphingobium sp.]|nr:hypothetical protein [Novosphingobium sp.]
MIPLLRRRVLLPPSLAFAALACGTLPVAALADEAPRALKLEGSYVADVDAVVDGPQKGTRYV